MADEVRCSCGECQFVHATEWVWVREYVVEYCPSCGDRLNEGGSTTRMVPAAPSEAVRETLLWRLLDYVAGGGMARPTDDVADSWDAGESLGLLDPSTELTAEGRTIYAALAAGGDAADLREAVVEYMVGTATCPNYDNCPLPLAECGAAHNEVCIKRVNAWLDNVLATYRAEREKKGGGGDDA